MVPSSTTIYETILLPIDGSDDAFEATDRAFEIVRTTDATVHALYVVDTGGIEAATTEDADPLREAAERRGREMLATVDALYVVDDAIQALADAPRSIVGLLREAGLDAVESVATAARERELSVTTEVVRGIPDEEILQYADGVDADLIAMGTRGLGASDDRLLGSATGRVLGRSDRPVLVIG